MERLRLSDDDDDEDNEILIISGKEYTIKKNSVRNRLEKIKKENRAEKWQNLDWGRHK